MKRTLTALALVAGLVSQPSFSLDTDPATTGTYRSQLHRSSAGIISEERLTTHDTGTGSSDAQFKKLHCTLPELKQGPSTIEIERQAWAVVHVAPASLQPTLAITEALVGQTLKDCAECPDMVVIPAGSFQMGSNDGADEEKPIHRVNIKRFVLGKYEVTQGQWTAVMGNEHERSRDCGDSCPAQVSWENAQEFVRKLNAKSGQRYRLPSEAEWEYAARAGTTTKYSWGNEIGRNNANCDGCGSQWDDKTPAPVGSFKPNPFGLHDMHGNEWEWVQDEWHHDYKGAPTDGSAWEQEGNGGVLRVMRGGAWHRSTQTLSASYRDRYHPRQHNFFVGGFRIARNTH